MVLVISKNAVHAARQNGQIGQRKNAGSKWGRIAVRSPRGGREIPPVSEFPPSDEQDERAEVKVLDKASIATTRRTCIAFVQHPRVEKTISLTRIEIPCSFRIAPGSSEPLSPG